MCWRRSERLRACEPSFASRRTSVYQNQEWVWPYRETDPLGGYDPYASSKACAEIVSAAYRTSFFSPDSCGRTSCRVGYGSGRKRNWRGGLVGGPIDSRPHSGISGSKDRFSIRRPNAIRPWQHVLEPLHGYIMLAEQLLAERVEFASSFNFGPSDDDAWPVGRIATYSREAVG